jgi:phospholipid transport system substrate-binding protein
MIGLLWASMSFAAEIDPQKAEDFIKQVTTQGIEEIINSDVSAAEKNERFAKLFNEYLDVAFIGRFVLGRYWKTANPTQRTDFIDVYRELNVQTWSKRFDEFKGKTFIFNGTAPSNSAGQIFVNTTVPMDQGAPAKVVWRVNETNGKLKVIDIIIENVSLAITARNEYTTYIKKSANGVQGLIDDLRQKTK